MKNIQKILILFIFLAGTACKENGNDGNDNTRGGKTFEHAISNDSAGREQTIDGEESRTDTTNIKTGEKNH
ncbi:MAG: hypothetical protein H7329_14635 [Opitutaceae bacterium]|nr:hypothetical protein [Cytophagales bacterium]